MRPSRRRAGNRHAPQKSFLCISGFVRARFFLLKGKENFFVLLCSDEQGGGLGLSFLQEHGGIPPTPPFRRVLAGTDGIFGGDIILFLAPPPVRGKVYGTPFDIVFSQILIYHGSERLLVILQFYYYDRVCQIYQKI